MLVFTAVLRRGTSQTDQWNHMSFFTPVIREMKLQM